MGGSQLLSTALHGARPGPSAMLQHDTARKALALHRHSHTPSVTRQSRTSLAAMLSTVVLQMAGGSSCSWVIMPGSGCSGGAIEPSKACFVEGGPVSKQCTEPCCSLQLLVQPVQCQACSTDLTNCSHRAGWLCKLEVAIAKSACTS